MIEPLPWPQGLLILLAIIGAVMGVATIIGDYQMSKYTPLEKDDFQ